MDSLAKLQSHAEDRNLRLALSYVADAGWTVAFENIHGFEFGGCVLVEAQIDFAAAVELAWARLSRHH